MSFSHAKSWTIQLSFDKKHLLGDEEHRERDSFCAKQYFVLGNFAIDDIVPDDILCLAVFATMASARGQMIEPALASR